MYEHLLESSHWQNCFLFRSTLQCLRANMYVREGFFAPSPVNELQISDLPFPLSQCRACWYLSVKLGSMWTKSQFYGSLAEVWHLVPSEFHFFSRAVLWLGPYFHRLQSSAQTNSEMRLFDVHSRFLLATTGHWKNALQNIIIDFRSIEDPLKQESKNVAILIECYALHRNWLIVYKTPSLVFWTARAMFKPIALSQDEQRFLLHIWCL